MGRLIIIVLLVVAGSFAFFSNQKQAFPHESSMALDAIPVDSNATRLTASIPRKPLFIARPANPHWQTVISEYENYLQQSLQRNLAPGVAIAIVQDSAILYANGMGFRDFTNGDSVDVHSVFRLGSVSKSLAAVLTGILVQKKILNWNDKVISYLPGFRLKSKAYTDSLTIGHLLSHTSGLPYHAFTDRVDEGVDFDTLVYHLRDLELTGPPGKMYSYQNVGFSLIGKVIESATGKSYEQVMQEELFQPMSMETASLTFAAMASAPNKARPHQLYKKVWRSLPISYTYYNVGPAGGVNASISDMARWLRSLTNRSDTLLNSQTKNEIFRPAVKAIARNRNFGKWKKSKGSYYGMGWRVLTFRDDTVNYHGGYVNGFRSEVAIKRDDRIGICVLVNSSGPLADHAIPEFFRLYEKHRLPILRWEAAYTKALLASER